MNTKEQFDLIVYSMDKISVAYNELIPFGF